MNLTLIDIGNFNIKYLGERMGLFSSKYHTNFESNPEGFKRITVNEKTFYIGVGKYSLEYTKINKEAIIPQVLYAINEANEGNNITTNLCLLLPIEQLPKKQELMNIFQKKIFNSVIDGKKINIRIEKVIVLPECQVSRYSLTEDKQSEDILIIDLGSRTCNYAGYVENELSVNGTSRIGIINLYEKIMITENSKGNDYILEDIEPQIRRGKIVVEEEIYLEFLKEVLNSIKSKVSINRFDVVFTGGGALVLEDIINNIEGVKIHNEPINGNLLGAKVVCKELLK